MRVPEFEEIEVGEAEAVAIANAEGKAGAVPREPGETVLAVDTVVVLNGRLYGKPGDEADARATLRALSGATHTVTSGLALIDGRDGSSCSASCATNVRFRELDGGLIEWYVASGEWRERAGGYAIQGAGAALVRAIDGDWTNVVGLPVAALLDLHPALLTTA